MKEDNARKYCLEMLQDRGYVITEPGSTILAIKPDGKQVMVSFSQVPKFNREACTETLAEMNELEISHVIVVYRDGVTAHTRSVCAQFDTAAAHSDDEDPKKFELFAIEDLQYNIRKHRLQPVFERLSSEVAQQFKEDFGTGDPKSSAGYPAMKSTDPIVRHYGWKIGDVIKVTRGSGDMAFVAWRVVRK